MYVPHHEKFFNGFLDESGIMGLFFPQPHFGRFMEKVFFQRKGIMSLVVTAFYLVSFNTRLTSADRHFCHFRCFVQSFHRPVVLPPNQTKPGLHLVLHILLADKDDKHEEAAEQVEAVDDPEEDLDVVGVAAEPVRVV